MKKRIVLSLLFSFVGGAGFLFGRPLFDEPVWRDGRIQEKVDGAIFGSAIGDVLGRIPEEYWIRGGVIGTKQAKKYRDQWQKDYPDGISSFEDFREEDFETRVEWVNGRKSLGPWAPQRCYLQPCGYESKVAIYTDDTQMSLLVFKGLFRGLAQEHDDDWSIDLTGVMTAIAEEFSEWVVDPDGGLSAKRAPGVGCTRAARRIRRDLSAIHLQKAFAEADKETQEAMDDSPEIKKLLDTEIVQSWWAQGEGGELKPLSEGGCGSVMRAAPFGLMFADCPDKAAYYADQHSLLTHRAPIARAACAAMAKGVALAMQSDTGAENILKEMEEAALKIDRDTGKMIHDAVLYAKEDPSDEEIRSYLESLEGRLASQAIAATAFVFACEHEDLFRAIRLAINFYGDSDSVGAMVGALAGAYIGIDNLHSGDIHDKWIAPLEDRHKLEAIAGRVAGRYYHA